MENTWHTVLFLALALSVASVQGQDHVTPKDAFAPWSSPVFNTYGSRSCGSPSVKLAQRFAGERICFNGPAHYKLENSCNKNPAFPLTWGSEEYVIMRKWTLGGKTELFVMLIQKPLDVYSSTVYAYGLESQNVWTATTSETGYGDDIVLLGEAQVTASSTKRAIAHAIVKTLRQLAYGPADACRRDAKAFYPELQGLYVALVRATELVA